MSRRRNAGFWRPLAFLVALGCSAALVALPFTLADAAAMVVDTSADELDGNPGNGRCSLREAIANANKNNADQGDCPAGDPGLDSITFDAAVTGTITLLFGHLLIVDDLEIDGPGAEMLTVDGNGGSGVFNSGTPQWTVTGLAITGGDIGIFNDVGTLHLNDSVVSGNAGENGAGIHNSGGTILLNNSAVIGNLGADFGGGIYNYIQGTVILNSSLVAGNSADSGGGIYNWDGEVTLVNSTVSGNTANQGGGIFADEGDVTLINSTVSGNTAASGAGIAEQQDVGSTMLLNSIVASNGGDDCFVSDGGSIVSGGNNLDSDGSCNLVAAGDIQNGSADLGSLQDNGGPTLTHALLIGSDALDAGNGAVCADSPVDGADQRGVVRPQGLQCDIGAFELASEEEDVPPPDVPDPYPAAFPMPGAPTVQPTATPIPVPPTATPIPVPPTPDDGSAANNVVPPSTGDAGLR